MGRTGRAGRKGIAITFLDPSTEEKYAPDMVHALSASGQIVPVDLLNLAQNLLNNKSKGLVKSRELGYGGSGFKFDNCEEEILKEQKKAFACSVFNICDDILDNSEIEEPMLFENSYKS